MEHTDAHRTGSSRRDARIERVLADGHASQTHIRCQTCGEWLPAYLNKGREAKAGRNRKYCSDQCKDARTLERVCPVCGETFIGHKGKRACSSECASVLTRFSHGSNPSTPWACHLEFVVCGICGQPFARGKTSIRSAAHFCTRHSQDEVAEYTRERRRESDRQRIKSGRGRELDRAKNHRRRAARLSASVVEDIKPIEVFKRDGYRCHICGRKTDPSKRYPHPMSPSLDHIVPLSVGGDHSRANVATACLSCNLSKGNRAVGEQLRLIG